MAEQKKTNDGATAKRPSRVRTTAPGATQTARRAKPPVDGARRRANAAKGATATRSRTGGGAKRAGTKNVQRKASTPRASGQQARSQAKSPKATRRPAAQDLFLERAPKPVKPAKKQGVGALDVLFALGIAGMLALMLWQRGQHVDFLQMKQAVERQTFYAGTTVETVDVSNMTLGDAMDYWQTRVEPRYANRQVALDDGTTVTAQQLGYASDYAEVLSNAWSAGRSGSLEERYRQVLSRQGSPVAYGVNRRLYSEAAVDAFVAAMADQVNRPARSASIESFDAETYKFVFGEAQAGAELDAAALKRDVEQALEAGGGSVSLAVSAIAPEVTAEEIAGEYGLIAYAVTNASSSSKNRLANIKLAMSYINGTCIKPGETFSFNKAVGQRTESRGFKLATAYSSGEVTEQVGGGICQVSTTLFNAAVKSDLEIVERHNHSLTVSYVDKGKDATVDWGHQDLRIKNTSDENVYICCYLTDDKRVRFGIFGRKLANGETITVEAKTTETIKYQTEYQPTPLLASGKTEILQPGRDGYVAEAYKVRWDADGNQISRELLCKSRYQAKNEIVAYGA